MIEAIKKTIDKCNEFSKKVLTTHNKCQTSSKRRMDELLPHEEHLKKLHARFQEEELDIQLIKNIDERVIKYVISQATLINCLLEDHIRILLARMDDIRA